MDGETPRPPRHLGRDNPAVRRDHAGRLDAYDVRVLVDADAEPLDRLAQVPLGLLVEPVAEAAPGGDRDVEVGPGRRDLGARLEACEAPADDQHAAPRG